MLYTIGHAVNYRRAYKEAHDDDGVTSKIGYRAPSAEYPNGYAGGVVYKTPEEAEAGIVQYDKVGEWTVWVIEGEWERDTYRIDTGEIRLYNDCVIVRELNPPVETSESTN